MNYPEEMIKKYGEKYRRMIEDATKWLEPVWGCEKIDYEQFISGLIERVAK